MLAQVEIKLLQLVQLTTAKPNTKPSFEQTDLRLK